MFKNWSTSESSVGEGAQNLAPVSEGPLEIWINDRIVGVVMRTPGEDTELVAGHMLTEGFVDSAEQIEHIRGKKRGDGKVGIINAYTLNHSLARSANQAGLVLVEEPAPGFMQASAIADRLRERARPLVSNLVFDMAIITAAMELFQKVSSPAKLTPGTEGVALVSITGILIAARNDIGGHNALDKAVGHALLKGARVNDCCAFTTGLISHDIVQKAVVAGIPAIISCKAATSLAIELAREMNMTLAVGRQNGLFIYTSPERVKSVGSSRVH